MQASILRSFHHFLLWRVLRRDTVRADAPEFGLKLRVVVGDAVGRHIFKRGSFDAERTRLLLRSLRFADGDVILDIGSNIGWYSLVLDRYAGAAVRIFAFEPDERNHGLLLENLHLNDCSHIVPVKKAVSDRTGVQQLYLYPTKNLGRHSLLPINDGATQEVETVTLDGFLSDAGIPASRVKFVKLDIEGYEYLALQGGRTLLGVVPLILLEYSPKYMRKAGQDPKKLLDLLFGAGYTPFTVDGPAPVQVDRDQLYATEDQGDHLWSLPGALPPVT